MTHFKVLLISILLYLPLCTTAQDTFPLPDVPTTLKGVEVRANYLALHYWDKFDFSDNTHIGNKDVTEQGFSNFISIMPYVSEKEAAFGSLAAKMVSNSRMLQYIMALGVKYLSEPMSPLYNEDLYIMFLQRIVAQEGISERDYEDAKFDLSMAMKNCIGTKAANFSYLKRDGKRSELAKTKGEYILLFMGDPDCDICSVTKEEIVSNAVLKKYIDSGTLTVLSVCVEGKTDMWEQTPSPAKWIDACDDKQVIYEKLLYDIPGLPILYLLDKEHNVIMKNVQVSHIAEFFINK